VPRHEPLTDALLDPATYAGDAHAVFAKLRADAPVAWNATSGFWAVSRHADVMTVSTDTATFCSSQGILVQEIGHPYETPPTMMHTDPPAHTRYRKLVQPAFKPSVMRDLEAMIGTRTALLLDEVPLDAPVDIVAAVAAPLPLYVIGAVLGLPDGDYDRLWRWSDAAIPGAGDLSDDERMTLMGEMTVELLGLAAKRREDPHDDVASVLATVVLDGEMLTDDELGMFLVQLFVAGNETTRHAISGGLVALAESPEQWERLRNDRALVPVAAEEMLRWTTPVISFMRTATREVELGGTTVAAGEPVLMLYGSADRDESVFPNADRFDAGRDPNHHVAFGFGTHFCLGAALARLELRIVLEQMLDRYATVATAGPVKRSGSSIIAGLEHAPLLFTSG
jgi:cytochrome P450